MKKAFSLIGVVKEYLSRDRVAIKALEGISLEAYEGQITAIVGPTGSGKSTILRIASGLEQPDSGEVMAGGSGTAELKKAIGYMTQHHTLFPWMKIISNISLPLEIKGTDMTEIKRLANGICEMLGLKGAENLYPYELSGGMQQRAALGRLLASGSSYWLMDEPFTALDERTRHQLQRLLLTIVRENNLSVLFVTHSIDEAVFLADRAIVLSAGPGRVVDFFDIDNPHPRDRLSPQFASDMERIRQKIESVLEQA